MFRCPDRVRGMSNRTLAAHVLRSLAIGHSQGHAVTLDGLSAELRVRRADVRSVITALHKEGYVNAATMRLTLRGFTVGTALGNVELPALRTAPRLYVVAAA
jgi:hypothetical protein